MKTIKERLAKGFVKENSIFEDGTIVKLSDFGHDMGGKFAHINVSLGVVDVRKTRSKFYRKNASGVMEGYQRIPTEQRIENITSEFTRTKLNPITVAIMPDGIDVIDGQGRDTAVKTLYRQNKITDCRVPCIILENATEEDCAMLFAEQDKNTVYISVRDKTKVEAANNQIDTITFLKKLNANGLPVYNEDTKELFHGFNAVNTYKLIYKSFSSDPQTFDRVISVISQAWVTNEASGKHIAPKALQSDIIRGVAEMYVRYKDEINDDVFIKKLQKYQPCDVLETFVRNTPKKTEAISDKKYKYIRTLVDIYNSGKCKQGKKLAY